MGSDKGLTGGWRYVVRKEGRGDVLHAFQRVHISGAVSAVAVTSCMLSVEANAWWRDCSRDEPAELCEACFDDKGNVRRAPKPHTPACVARNVHSGAPVECTCWVDALTPADERTLFVQARGSEFWHVTDRASTPSLDARTICGAAWGGAGWNMGTQNEFGPPRKICKSCAGVLAALAAKLAAKAQDRRRVDQDAERDNARAELLLTCEQITTSKERLHDGGIKLFAEAVAEYLKAGG